MERRKQTSETHKTWVVAGSNISRGACYGPVAEVAFRFADDRAELQDGDTVIKIFAQDGTLTSELPNVAWMQHLPASRDVYEQNLEIYRSHDNQISVRITRDVKPGERLNCWYEELYSMEINVPYLTPLNIRGIAEYRCTDCGDVYAYPNMLKIHLMRHCIGAWPRYNCDIRNHRHCLNRLQPSNDFYADNAISDIRTRSNDVNDFKTHTFQSNLDNHKSSRLDSKTMKTTIISTPPLQVLSDNGHVTSINCSLLYGSGKTSVLSPYKLNASLAFFPIYKKAQSLDHQETWMDMPSSGSDVIRFKADFRHEGSHSSPLYSESDEEPMDILHKSFIEFSTAKGHMCVYCGKFYSRKYGLKIHLRTHTGYKPLKCKTCFRAFGDPSNLNKHTRLHSEGNTPYKCDQCGKVLVRRRDLVRHLNSRHPDVRIKEETHITD